MQHASRLLERPLQLHAPLRSRSRAIKLQYRRVHREDDQGGNEGEDALASILGQRSDTYVNRAAVKASPMTSAINRRKKVLAKICKAHVRCRRRRRESRTCLGSRSITATHIARITTPFAACLSFSRLSRCFHALVIDEDLSVIAAACGRTICSMTPTRPGGDDDDAGPRAFRGRLTTKDYGKSHGNRPSPVVHH